jgi:hypothetical protein
MRSEVISGSSTYPRSPKRALHQSRLVEPQGRGGSASAKRSGRGSDGSSLGPVITIGSAGVPDTTLVGA